MRDRARAIILGSETNIGRKTYFWTVASGIMYSGSSVIMLWAVTHLLGPSEAGVFSIALAISQQLLTVGFFCMRTYQASDVDDKFSFSNYLTSRVITCAILLIAGIVWVIAGDFYTEKAVIVLMFCLYKAMEAFADVFEGLYQKHGRFDIAVKGHFLRFFCSTLAFLISLYFSRNLVQASFFLATGIILAFLLYDPFVVGYFDKFKIKFDWGKLLLLFLACLPLFASSFLSAYINNSAKYAIDSYLSSDIQTYFNILFMPAFVINLFGGFIIKPQLTALALRYRDGNMKGFFSVLKRQVFYVTLITLGCLVVAYFLGIPVLNWFYGVDLDGYRPVLLILLIAGGFSALYNVFYYAITIMRHQYSLLIGYGIITLCALLAMPMAVKSFGIYGASICYLILMILQTVIFAVIAFVYVRRLKQEK